MVAQFPTYTDDYYYNREKLLKECLPLLNVYSDTISDHQCFFSGKMVSMLGFSVEEKVWLRKFIHLNGGKGYHKRLDNPDIIIFGDNFGYYDMLNVFNAQQNGSNVVVVSVDTVTGHIDSSWQRRIEDYDNQEAIRKSLIEINKQNREEAICDEESLSKLNWVEETEISLFDDIFCAFGKLGEHSEWGEDCVEYTSKDKLYKSIEEKFGIVRRNKFEHVTCIIMGDKVTKKSLDGFNGNVKYISYTKFKKWLEDATPASPEFKVFRTKYSSIKDERLRPYQQEAKDRIFHIWREVNCVMLQMPTGAGKTMLFSSVIRDITNVPESQILIIAHRSELIDQIDEHLNKYHVSHGIIASNRKRDLSIPVQIASIQTLTHKNNEQITKDFVPGFIIVDEAHHTLAKTYNKLWTLYPKAWKLGVTATPCRLNCASFQSHFSEIIESLSITQMIQHGYLSDYVFYTENPDSTLSKAIASIKEKSSTGDYRIADLLKNLNIEEHVTKLVLSYTQYANGLKGIVYAISIEHASNICNAYKNIGVEAEFIDSNTPKKERDIIVQDFKSGKIQVMVNVDIFSEGFDCPDVEFVQMARPTWSLSKYMQQVGRGLRISNGKNKTVILDNAGMFSRFGLPSEEHPWKRLFNGGDYRDCYADNIYKANSYLRIRHANKEELMLKVDKEDAQKALRSSKSFRIGTKNNVTTHYGSNINSALRSKSVWQYILYIILIILAVVGVCVFGVAMLGLALFAGIILKKK